MRRTIGTLFYRHRVVGGGGVVGGLVFFLSSIGRAGGSIIRDTLGVVVSVASNSV